LGLSYCRVFSFLPWSKYSEVSRQAGFSPGGDLNQRLKGPFLPRAVISVYRLAPRRAAVDAVSGPTPLRIFPRLRFFPKYLNVGRLAGESLANGRRRLAHCSPRHIKQTLCVPLTFSNHSTSCMETAACGLEYIKNWKLFLHPWSRETRTID